MKILLITLVIVNLLTVLAWVTLHRKAKPAQTQYAANNTNPDYKYEIRL